MNFDNMPDGMKSTEVYHHLENCSNTFSRLSPLIPIQHLRVVQTIHGELCESLVLISQAGNEPMPDKLGYLRDAERKLFYLHVDIQYLVNTRAISIGQANEFVSELKEAHRQASKWLKAMTRTKVSSP